MAINLNPHILVGKAIPPDGVVELTGFLGPSEEAGHVRLYFDLDFCSYCEIPKANGEIVLTIAGKDEGSPTKLYLKAETPIELVQVSRLSVEASFLQGKIATTHLEGSARPVESIFSPIGPTQDFFHCQQALAVCTIKECNGTKNCPTASRH